MGILLGFAPFIVFAVLSRLATPAVSLWAAAATSGILLAREKMRGKSLKILEAGTFVLFAALALYASFANTNWDIPLVRTIVDAGLLFIVLLSMLLRKPFTLQYAREQVPAEVQSSPEFLKTNYLITAVWALALAIIVAADISLHAFPNVPHKVGVLTIVGALYGAFWFTGWYPEQLAKRAG